MPKKPGTPLNHEVLAAQGQQDYGLQAHRRAASADFCFDLTLEPFYATLPRKENGTMSTITFDTLKFVEKLKTGGVPEAQAKAEAEALVSAFSEAMDSQLATKTDINRLEKELAVLKWMTGIVMGGILALILKAFFPV
ncbi:MAG: hypothetical protein M0Q22_08465 [Sulfuritalea sp.]|nr:hypothetical protein [Sulfuritalea sp.]